MRQCALTVIDALHRPELADVFSYVEDIPSDLLLNELP
jgi:hypothetical protein